MSQGAGKTNADLPGDRGSQAAWAGRGTRAEDVPWAGGSGSEIDGTGIAGRPRGAGSKAPAVVVLSAPSSPIGWTLGVPSSLALTLHAEAQPPPYQAGSPALRGSPVPPTVPGSAPIHAPAAVTAPWPSGPSTARPPQAARPWGPPTFGPAAATLDGFDKLTARRSRAGAAAAADSMGAGAARCNLHRAAAGREAPGNGASAGDACAAVAAQAGDLAACGAGSPDPDLSPHGRRLHRRGRRS